MLAPLSMSFRSELTECLKIWTSSLLPRVLSFNIQFSTKNSKSSRLEHWHGLQVDLKMTIGEWLLCYDTDAVEVSKVYKILSFISSLTET